MIRYIAIRIGQGALVVLGAVAVSFVLVSVAGDPVTALGGAFTTPAEKARLAHLYGYDRPLLEQFLDYMGSVLHGDFGDSFRQPVGALTLVMQALPATIYLVLGAMIVTIVIAVPVALFLCCAVVRWSTAGSAAR